MTHTLGLNRLFLVLAFCGFSAAAESYSCGENTSKEATACVGALYCRCPQPADGETIEDYTDKGKCPEGCTPKEAKDDREACQIAKDIAKLEFSQKTCKPECPWFYDLADNQKISDSGKCCTVSEKVQCRKKRIPRAVNHHPEI
jgi:hypothetical protein